MPGTLPKALYVSSHLILTTVLQGRHYYLCKVNEYQEVINSPKVTETDRGGVKF